MVIILARAISLVALVFALRWLYDKIALSEQQGASPQLAPRRVGRANDCAPADDPFDVAVVGVAHYQEPLRSLAGQRSSHHYCYATLVPDACSLFDIVRVSIDGHAVGYLDSKVAVEYQRKYRGMPRTVGAVIFRKDSGGDMEVWLSLCLS
jgi:hypothetical protein